MAKFLKVNHIRGWLRIWLISVIVVFIYIYPTSGQPIDDVHYIPHFILSNAIYLYNFIYGSLGYPSDYCNLIWAFSVTLLYSIISIAFGYAILWVAAGFKQA